MSDEAKETSERPQWEQMQAKTFTKWCNMYLKRKNLPIITGEIHKAFENGIKLMQLICALYDADMPKKYTKLRKCKLRPMKLDNINIAMAMMKEQAIKTNFLKNVNIVDGDWKMMLGMIWSIILDYNMKGIGQGEHKNLKQGLLIWCNKQIEGYRPDVKQLKNFSTNWQDGRAFAAIVNKFVPEQMDFDKDAEPAANMEKAFTVMEGLGIERLLDVEDLTEVPKPDDKSVMTYVAEMYKVFSKFNMKEKSAEHVKKFLDFQRNIRNLQSDYETRAEAWMQSCDGQIKEFNESKEAENATEAAEQLQSYKKYILEIQPKMISEKIELEELYTNIQSQLKVNKRVKYTCDMPPEKLEESAEKLNESQKKFYETARDKRFEFVEALKPTEISQDQIKEWNEAFDHFDENKNDYLEFDEFSAALKAVGVPLTDEAEKARFKELKAMIQPEDSPVKVACVDRGKFLGFLENMYTADDTVESVIASMDMLSKSDKLDVSKLVTPPLTEEDREFLKEILAEGEDGTYDFAAFTQSQFAA